MGARQIVAVDLADDKLALARKLDATHLVNAHDPGVAERIRADTQGGVELTSGTLSLDEFNHGFDLLHEGKTVRQVVLFPS